MPNESTDTQDRCAFCESAIDEDSDTSFYLEIQRGEDQWHDASFCSQDHVARWFDRPLPAFRSADDDDDLSEWAGCLIAIGCLTVLVLTLALIVAGVYQAITWIS